MRPASSSVVNSWITVLCLLAALLALDGLASAQDAGGSKHKLSQQPVSSPQLAASVAGARPATHNAPPALTTDTWSGRGGGKKKGAPADKVAWWGLPPRAPPLWPPPTKMRPQDSTGTMLH